MSKYLSVKEYAEAEGVKTSAIYNRIKRGTLESIWLHGIRLVDVDSFKPKKARKKNKSLQ